LIRELLENQKEGKKRGNTQRQIREDGAVAATPLHRQFILTNPLVFEAKEMALEGEIAKIDVFIEKLLANLKKYPMKLKSSPAQMMSLGSMLVRNSKILRSVSSLPVLEPVHVHPPYVHTFMLYALKLVWAG
jgi:hypothetical protein